VIDRPDDLATSVMLEDYSSPAGRWPFTADDWERRAAEVLDKPNFDYIAGGAGEEWTMRANRDAFYRWRLRPRMLTGNVERSFAVEVLGLRSAYPVWLAPVGVQTLAHPDGELATARAARATGTPLVLSTASSTPMEAVAEALEGTPAWFQLYWVDNREVVASLVARAERAGFKAIVVTLDTLRLGWRDRDLANAFLPFVRGAGIGQFVSDPVFRSLVGPAAEDPATAGMAMLAMHPNPALRWADFAWLRSLTSLPIVVKGVLRAEDAVQALEAKIDGIVVSNHGGRQVDGAVAALDALPEVRAAVGPDYPLVFDSGVRRGADVLKALALGADAVLLGRPYMYGLAVGGQAGVERVLRSLLADLDANMSLLGAASVAELDRSWLSRAP
jgi:lactate 2-monooxygenase